MIQLEHIRCTTPGDSVVLSDELKQNLDPLTPCPKHTSVHATVISDLMLHINELHAVRYTDIKCRKMRLPVSADTLNWCIGTGIGSQEIRLCASLMQAKRDKDALSLTAQEVEGTSGALENSRDAVGDKTSGASGLVCQQDSTGDYQYFSQPSELLHGCFLSV